MQTENFVDLHSVRAYVVQQLHGCVQPSDYVADEWPIWGVLIASS